jgi:CRP-like cAMP-binding protein
VRIELAGCDVTRRLARVIHEIALTYGEPAGDRVAIRCPLTQPELATLAKASDATVSKALRRLREAHVVVTGYRSVAVADLSALHQAAYG